MMLKEEMDLAFATDVYKGLTQEPKKISSKYFYDQKGDRLFQEIMELEEYYLTRAEYEIFREQSEEIVRKACGTEDSVELIELGAGDGTKTRVLLQAMRKAKIDILYRPIDISGHAIEMARNKIQLEHPEIEVQGIEGTYEFGIETISRNQSKRKRIFLFLGSNLGNMSIKESQIFMKRLSACLKEGDQFLIGLDKKKDPKTILAAYDDREGVTAKFNLNLLDRMNRELGTNFNAKEFFHVATYDDESGTAKSFLVSKKDQRVHLPQQKESIHFRAQESIHTEISQKYDDAMLDKIFSGSKLHRVADFQDSKNLFCDYLFEKESV